MRDYLSPRYERFSHHVAECVRNRDYGIVQTFMGPDCILNGSRIGDSGLGRIFGEEPTQPDDWAMGLSSWCFGLFPKVWLCRGPKRYNIKLTKQEHRGLALIIRAIFQERKDLAKQKKMQHKIAEQNAYWRETNATARYLDGGSLAALS